MSQASNQQLDSLLAGGQLLGQASANQRISMENQRSGQALDLQRRGQDLQDTQHQRELGAQRQNYKMLNESKERMENANRAQQADQFTRGQAQDKDLLLMQREFSLQLQKISAEKARISAEAITGIKDNAQLRKHRADRKAVEEQSRRLEMAMGATMHAYGMAGKVKEQRGEDVSGRITAFQGANKTARDAADQAVSRGVQDAFILNARSSGGFAGETLRSMRNNPVSNPLNSIAAPAAMAEVFFENMIQALGIQLPTGAYEDRMTPFETTPMWMANSMMTASFGDHGDAFGLEGPKRAAAQVVFQRLLNNSALLVQADESLPLLDAKKQTEVQQTMAKDLGELRKLGMKDLQIAAFIDGLETVGENATEMISTLSADGAEGVNGTVLDKTLRGVGRLADGVSSVLTNDKLMGESGGGTFVDHSKYDYVGMNRRAMTAFAQTSDDPRAQALGVELNRVGMSPEDQAGMWKSLMENDPALARGGFSMDPDVLQQLLAQQSSESGALKGQAKASTEEEALSVQRFLGQGEVDASAFEASALDDLIRNARPGNGVR